MMCAAVMLMQTRPGHGQSGPPGFPKQPSSQMPYVGDTATFSLIVTGTPPMTFQWRLNGADLPGKTASGLVLANVKFTNAGPYSVVVSNAGGAITSQVAWLSVLPTNVVSLGDRDLSFGQLSSPIWAAPRKDDEAQTITGDGLTLYYNSTAPGGSGSNDLWMVTRPTQVSTNWSAPVNLGPTVNSPFIDAGPVLSPDGLSLYFSSTRQPGGQGGYDMWVATRATLSDPFRTPVNLGPAVNSSSDDIAGYISADNLTMVFTSSRPGSLGYQDVWMSTRTNASAPWQPAVHLPPPINVSSQWNFPVGLSRDGLTMFLKSTRPISEGPEYAAMYVCHRPSADQPFGPPILIRALLGIGTGGLDYSSLSDDGRTLYVGTYRTQFPDWPQVVQIGITPLPQLTAAGRGAGGVFQLDLLGREGATYEIQTSPDLRTWTPWLTTNTAGSVRLSDPTPAQGGYRFYRVLSH